MLIFKEIGKRLVVFLIGCLSSAKNGRAPVMARDEEAFGVKAFCNPVDYFEWEGPWRNRVGKMNPGKVVVDNEPGVPSSEDRDLPKGDTSH